MQGAPAVRQYVLSNASASRVAGKVLECRDLFETCDGSPLFSLGTPAYRFQGEREDYVQAVRETNTLLIDRFSDLYRAVLGSLGNLLGQHIRLVHDVAIPGFHIMELQEGMPYHPGPPHRDAPYSRIPWRDASKVVPEHNLSFVLPLALPPGGAGVDFYPYQNDTVAPPQWEEIAPTTVEYRVGEMCLFTGNRYHRLAPMHVFGEAKRITLQGHILRLDGEYIAYW